MSSSSCPLLGKVEQVSRAPKRAMCGTRDIPRSAWHGCFPHGWLVIRNVQLEAACRGGEMGSGLTLCTCGKDNGSGSECFSLLKGIYILHLLWTFAGCLRSPCKCADWQCIWGVKLQPLHPCFMWDLMRQHGHVWELNARTWGWVKKQWSNVKRRL